MNKLKIKKSAALFAPLIAAMIGFITPNAQAAVQVTQFDPPLSISPWAEPTGTSYFNVLAMDFNADDAVDFRLASGLGGLEAYFNGPIRVAKRVTQPNLNVVGGPVAAVPLNSRIGTNIVSPGTNVFAWSTGYTNNYDLTLPLGDHEAAVISANLAIPTPLPGPIIAFTTNGTLTTNFYFPGPFVSGDVIGREGVMAVEFNVSGETHYGYIHFDFRAGGASGVIYGWAYETEPNVAIKAKPLSTNKTRIRLPKSPAVITPRRPILDPGVKDD